MTTDTTQGHRPSSKSERNLIIPQVNINEIKNKLEELKLLIHDTHADITIQETKLTHKVNTPKVHNFTTVRADRLHKAGGRLITLIRDKLHSLKKTYLSTINTHNTELQFVMVYINNTKHIMIANIYIPPRTKYIHILHTPPPPLIPRTTLLDTILEPRVPPTCPALTTTTPHASHTPALPSPSHPQTLSIDTCNTNNSRHISHRNHHIHIGYHDNLTVKPKTTT